MDETTRFDGLRVVADKVVEVFRTHHVNASDATFICAMIVALTSLTCGDDAKDILESTITTTRKLFLAYQDTVRPTKVTHDDPKKASS